MAIIAIPTRLSTDWRDYHDHAVILASGDGYDSARPPGWPFVLSLVYRAAGPHPVAGELFGLGCALVVGIPHLPDRQAPVRRNSRPQPG